jgi:hypothetical protein
LVDPETLRLLADDNGEYFSRVIMRSAGTRFVPEGRVFYRRLVSKVKNRGAYLKGEYDLDASRRIAGRNSCNAVVQKKLGRSQTRP